MAPKFVAAPGRKSGPEHMHRGVRAIIDALPHQAIVGRFRGLEDGS